MKAVWSFWSKPFKAHYNGSWKSDKHHLLSWILSLNVSGKHFENTSLFTDDEGAELLVHKLGLRFDEVRTDLNQLYGQNAEWWVLGKLLTYSLQDQPFLHIDNDVYLWKQLPADVQRASVIYQNPEYFEYGVNGWYRPDVVIDALKATGGKAPDEWVWATGGKLSNAYCCGIFGGNHIPFIRHYSTQAIRFICNNSNQAAWNYLQSAMGQPLVWHNILFEQYYLGNCIDYHFHNHTSPYDGLTHAGLFSSFDDALNSESAARAGYTHLIGDAKRNPIIARDLEYRVAEDYPSLMENAERLCAGQLITA